MEFLLNSPLSKKPGQFESFFTLPIQVLHNSMSFEEKNYNGISVNTPIKQKKLTIKSLDCWRKDIFIPFCKFLGESFDNYFVKKTR